MKNKLGVSALVLLVLASLFAPRLLFAVQDNVRLTGIKTGRYESWDITNLVTDYENSLPLRLSAFAKGLEMQKTYYVATLETGSNRDAYDMIEKVWYQELITHLFDAGLFSKEVYVGYNIEQWKRYVVYDNDYENGVAFLLDYVIIDIPDMATMELLLDSQTQTVYYIKLVHDFSDMYPNMKESMFHYYNKLSIYYILADYYECEIDEDLEMQFFEDSMDYVIEVEPFTKTEVQLLEYGGSISMNMVYTDASLEGILQLTREGDNLVVEAGLADIAELIPELSLGEEGKDNDF